MKIRIISDIHVNLNKELTPTWEKDDILTIIAGDISNNIKETEKWIKDNFNKVIFIEGNHMLYADDNIPIQHKYQELKKLFPKTGEHIFLENDYVILNDIVFIGSTFWPDYTQHEEKNVEKYLNKNAAGVNGRYIEDNIVRRITKHDFSVLHNAAKKYIDETCELFKNKKIVLILHHLPSNKSIAEKYQNHWSNFSMVSDLTEVLHKHTNIKIIIHGHTHSSHSYFINNTQIICNPHGRFDNNVMENEKFDHDLIIEI